MRRLDGLTNFPRARQAVTAAKENPALTIGGLLLALAVVVFLLWVNLSTKTVAGQTEEPIPLRPAVVNSPVALPTPASPVSLSAPAIGLAAQIEKVGLTKNGAMAVPTNTNNVGWFDQGYRPGEVGNAVLTGHVDTIWLQPAVFARLDQLKIGDEITVADQNNHQFTFKVRKIAHYDVKNLPLQTIFGSAPVPQLNLITCSGKWSWRIATYTERTVVYTSLE
ncbi:MAG TPA: class F sortase [Candidatus Saccharimonadales bacterium]|nr:class F sortase [Candidatus Saccharimonadales bacterium]